MPCPHDILDILMQERFMQKKQLPFTKNQIEKIIKKYPTPFHIYDEKQIRANVRRLNKAFSWVKGFKNHFAVKALPNPFILKILKEEAMGVDCSSLPELLLAEKIGLKGEQIMFSSNDTPIEEYAYAKKLGAIINFDDISHISFFEKNVGKLKKIKKSCIILHVDYIIREEGEVKDNSEINEGNEDT